MNIEIKILLLYSIMVGCASAPKPIVKKKAGTTASASKTVKGTAPVKAPVKAPPAPPPPAEEEAAAEEEEDDQFSRIKKYYKK